MHAAMPDSVHGWAGNERALRMQMLRRKIHENGNFRKNECGDSHLRESGISCALHNDRFEFGKEVLPMYAEREYNIYVCAALSLRM